MRRNFTYFSAALVFFFVLLTFSSPYTAGTALARTDKCDECVARCGRQEEQCYAQHGFDEIRCADQKNECVVKCFARVCEQ